MVADSWDSESDDGAPAPAAAPAPAVPFSRKNFDDEEEDEDVKDSWDASSSEDEKPKSTAEAPKVPTKKKGITKQKIAQKEAEEQERQRKAAERAAEENESVQARKLREKNAVLKSDLDNAATLFGQANINDAGGPEAIFQQRAKTDEDFRNIATQLAGELVQRYSTSPYYALFTQYLSKEIAAPLSDQDTRKMSSSLTTLANEKLREAKAKDSKNKKPKKPALAGTRSVGRADTRVYDEALDDDFVEDTGDFDPNEDFM